MTSRERILNAAVSVFARKGKHGTRMEEIAATAHINKAMIYYFFHSKDELYYEVIRSFVDIAQQHFTRKVFDTVKEGRHKADFIRDYISMEIDLFSAHPLYAQICIEALTSRSDDISRAVSSIRSPQTSDDILNLIRKELEAGKREGIFRDIDADQLLITITELVMTYFFSSSFAQLLSIEIKDEKAFLEERKNFVINLVMNAILLPQKKNRNR